VVNALAAESNIASWAIIGADPPIELMRNRRNLFPKHPSNIKEEKTPLGALWRSTVAPGWGQFYSNKKAMGFAFPSIEGLLFGLLLTNFSKYTLAVDNLQKTAKLYEAETDPDEVLKLRTAFFTYEDEHKRYNKVMINTGYMIGTVWAINAVHAYIAGPNHIACVDHYFIVSLVFIFVGKKCSTQFKNFIRICFCLIQFCCFLQVIYRKSIFGKIGQQQTKKKSFD
jgi:hypothetical protein